MLSHPLQSCIPSSRGSHVFTSFSNITWSIARSRKTRLWNLFRLTCNSAIETRYFHYQSTSNTHPDEGVFSGLFSYNFIHVIVALIKIHWNKWIVHYPDQISDTTQSHVSHRVAAYVVVLIKQANNRNNTVPICNNLGRAQNAVSLASRTLGPIAACFLIVVAWNDLMIAGMARIATKRNIDSAFMLGRIPSWITGAETFSMCSRSVAVLDKGSPSIFGLRKTPVLGC